MGNMKLWDKNNVDLAEHWREYKDLQLAVDAPALSRTVRRLAGALENLLDITRHSTGVDGWHLNGDIEPWAQFEEVDLGEAALAGVIKELGGNDE